jgi:hypothetical protein
VNDFVRTIPSAIELYQEGDLKGLNIKELGQYLEETTQIPFRNRGNIYKKFLGRKTNQTAQRFARIKVKNPGKRDAEGSPFPAEVDYEKRRIKDPEWTIIGILYDGVLYQEVISDLILAKEPDFNRCIILFTNQLFGTWDRDDRRYHARVSLYGFPNLISVTGLVEAPAKPKEYYLKRQIGLPVEMLKEEYRNRFLDHGDLRMTEVVKGYAMQALFFHVLGDPFCEDPDCRLFNSHWQEEVLHAQLNGRYEFCPRHEGMLKDLRGKAACASTKRDKPSSC